MNTPMKPMKELLLTIAITIVVVVICPIAIFVAPFVIAYKIYEFIFFSGKFVELKGRISKYVAECNDLNRHIESLKDANLVDNRISSGTAQFSDNSQWNMKRPEMGSKKTAAYRYDCSRQVCDNARKEPFKYLCKYFKIDITEESLEKFEEILNNFEAAEEGKKYLIAERKNIIEGIRSEIPSIIQKLSMGKVEKNLGFEPVDLSTIYFPRYTFIYTSSGGNASTKCEIVMNLENLNNFVVYLSERIKFKKSAAGQRALMTSRLRQQIKERDNYTCRQCGISTMQEPHLLLEIDHIVPVAAGGLTEVENLQTLCWKCNRTKGAKVS